MIRSCPSLSALMSWAALALLVSGCEPKPPHDEAMAAGAPDLGAKRGPSQRLTKPVLDVVYEGQGELRAAKVELMFEVAGLRLERQRWKLKDLEGVAWRVRVPRASARVGVRAVPKLEPFDALLPSLGADSVWAAINGGFYEDDPQGGYRPMGVVISKGRQAHDYKTRGGSGLLVVKDDEIKIIHKSLWPKKDKEIKAAADEALQSIDRIVDEGKSLVGPKPDARYAARSAVALTDDAVYLVAVAANASLYELEGGGGYRLRKSSYLGLPLWAFAQYLVEHTGARQALNLDGAVSTQLVVQARDKRFELIGERGTMSAVVLEAKPKP